jgi:hypothetical protein
MHNFNYNTNQNHFDNNIDKSIKVWKVSDSNELFIKMNCSSQLNKNDEILDLTFLSNIHLAISSRNGSILVSNIYTCGVVSEFKNNSTNIRQHLSLDYFPVTGDLAYSEARSIKIMNTGLSYTNISNIN